MADDPMVGRTIQGYRLIRRLGWGGMASVYLAQDPKLEREVALKILHGVDASDEIAAARFRQEALATARLEHPNIVHIYDFGWDQGLTYMVMEYCPNGSLSDMLEQRAQRRESIEPTQAVQIVSQIALALDFAHRSGIIHRDVKPSNILFARDWRPVLADLGIAKALEGPQLTRSMTTVGTPEYMSPEQARGQDIDNRTDLYSLSVVLYEMLAGGPPFSGNTPWSVVHQHIIEPPPPLRSRNPKVPAALALAVEKGLQKDPSDRYQSGQEMAQALTRALQLAQGTAGAALTVATQPAWVLPVAPSTPAAKEKRSSSKLIGVLLAVLALVAAVSVAAYLFDLPGRLLNPAPPIAAIAGESATDAAAGLAVAPSVSDSTAASPADTSLPPTATPVPEATAAEASQAAVVASPTNTLLRPTSTPLPTHTKQAEAAPTTTSAPPTNTATQPPPTATARPATATPARPGVVFDFEQLGRWERGDQPYGTLAASTEQVHDGRSAARLAYDFPAVDDNYVVFLKQPPAPIPGEPDALALWVYGDGSGRFLNVWVQDRAGEVRQFSFGKILHKDAWQRMTANLDPAAPWPQGHISGPDNSHLDYPASLTALVLDAEGTSAGSGEIYLDELTVASAVSTNATSPPTGASAVPDATQTATVAAPASATGTILFTAGGNVMAVNAANGATWQVAANARQPALRSDGRVLANGVGGGRESLFTAAIGGGDERVIGNHPEDSFPSWSPSGESAVFWSTIGDGRDRIYIQWNAGAAEEAARFQLGNTDIYGRNPTWLGDWRIAYSGCNYWESGSNCGIWAINSDGGGQPVQLTNRTDDVSNDSQGNSLLFSSQRSGNWDIYAVPTGGGNPRNLTNSPSQDAGAAFSPDGSYVAFMSDRDGGWGVWIMNADGSNPRKLLAVPAGFGGDWANERLAWGG